MGLWMRGPTPPINSKSNPMPISGGKISEAFIAHMKQASKVKQRPVFMWAHYYDPHSPYTKVKNGLDFGDNPQDRYDAELAFADEQVGKVVAEIDKHFDRANTIIIITADHGEAFDANHKKKHHGHDLHSTTVHIPLLVRAPFVEPAEFEGPVMAQDILPTIMNLGNIRGRHQLVGTSLVPQLLNGEDQLDRILYSVFYLPENVYHKKRTHIMLGVRTRHHNYFKDLRTSVERLFRYDQDPFETQNQIDLMPDQGRKMRQNGSKFHLWLSGNSVKTEKPKNTKRPPAPPKKKTDAGKSAGVEIIIPFTSIPVQL